MEVIKRFEPIWLALVVVAYVRVRRALALARKMDAQKIIIVDIDAGNETIRRIKSLARGTFPVPDTIYHWFATVLPVPGKPDMYDIPVTVAGHGVAYKLASRIPETH